MCKMEQGFFQGQIDELKPCPFCGGIPQTSSDGGCKNFVVFCSTCPAKVVIYKWGEESQQESIKAWNTRAPQGEKAK